MTAWRRGWRRTPESVMPSDGTLIALDKGVSCVSVEDAKAYLRVDSGIEDGVIDGAIRSVQDQLVPPEGWLGRALTDAQFRLDIPSFGNEIVLPAPPFHSIESFVYIDRDGDEQTVDADLYTVTDGTPAVIQLRRNKTWPTDIDTCRNDAVQITFNAGYGAPEDVPMVIRQWVKYQVSQIHDIRQPIVVGTIVSETPFIRSMLESWRVRL